MKNALQRAVAHDVFLQGQTEEDPIPVWFIRFDFDIVRTE